LTLQIRIKKERGFLLVGKIGVNLHAHEKEKFYEKRPRVKLLLSLHLLNFSIEKDRNTVFFHKADEIKFNNQKKL